MESKIYGVLDKDNCLIDVSLSERGTKVFATKNGYNKVGYRIGYNAFILAEKVKNKWEYIPTVNEFEKQRINEQEQHEQNMYCPKHENY